MVRHELRALEELFSTSHKFWENDSARVASSGRMVQHKLQALKEWFSTNYKRWESGSALAVNSGRIVQHKLQAVENVSARDACFGKTDQHKLPALEEGFSTSYELWKNGSAEAAS